MEFLISIGIFSSKVLLCNTVFCLAWPGVNLEAEQLSPLLDFQKILAIAETIA